MLSVVMVVRCKQEVYNWFQQLPAYSRIDFLCTLLGYCSPWEIRFLGTCLEQVARKSYNELQKYELKAGDYKELQERMLSSDINILDQDSNITHLIMSLALLRSRSTESFCSTIPFDIISRIVREFYTRINDVSPPSRLSDNIRVLLAMATHHPALTSPEQKQFHDYLQQLVDELGSQEPSSVMRDAQCQTDFTEVGVGKTQVSSHRVDFLYGSADKN